MKGKKDRICKNCIYWIRDFNWDKLTSKKDRRKMGNCYFNPPSLCQNLVPLVLREYGLDNLKNKQEMYQIRPITEHSDFCSNYTDRS